MKQSITQPLLFLFVLFKNLKMNREFLIPAQMFKFWVVICEPKARTQNWYYLIIFPPSLSL